jgi:hypothetical protein
MTARCGMRARSSAGKINTADRRAVKTVGKRVGASSASSD